MKRGAAILILVLMLFVPVCFCGGQKAKAEREYESPSLFSGRSDADKDVDELISKLDLSEINGLIASLSSDKLALFGFTDIAERLRAVASGEYTDDQGGIISYILGLLGADIFEFVPMLVGCVAIVIAYSLLNSIKSRFASESIERVVYFATGALAVTLVAGYFSTALSRSVGLITTVKTHINAVCPVLLTLMTAAGATGSASVYTPSVVILGGIMTQAVTYIAFPALIMGLTFDIIGSVSTGIKLTKTADFFRSVSKWFLGTSFFLFAAVMGVSGITASVRDGITVRAARFAVSKYVPVIGGYLSQGFDFVMAGNVLIKNALGSSAVVLIVLCAAPVITKLAVFTLMLKLTAAICEPLGGERMSGILVSVSKSSSLLAAVVVAMTFLYILFLSLIICTGNVGL